ncbi:MAG: hemerythrin domain-containing protein [Deltaproteobacteria bacterium]|nr:hemerythrin domain-containing protein [Deltaproteobacteria bacterium]
MLPIGPLMTEHRLIERMIALIRQDLDRIQSNVAVDPEFAFVDPVFIDTAVDFLRTYADRCHHGKEEDILFAELEKKDLAPEHRRLMEELKEEHRLGRAATRALVEAKESHLREEAGSLERLLTHLNTLTELYPRHIEKEDQQFFLPCMEYFSQAEKDDLLARMHEFDRRMIHEKYRQIVEGIETRRACPV